MASKYAGIVQDEIRDMRGNAMTGAVVIVRTVGTTTPATVYNNPVLIASAGGEDALVNDETTGLPAAGALLLPGIDANGNYTFYADADLAYDLHVKWQGQEFNYRVRPKVVDEAYTSVEDLTTALAGTFAETPDGSPATAVVTTGDQDVLGIKLFLGDLLAASGVPWVDARAHGAIADGTTHPLSERFGSLAAAQAVYPHASALTQEIDWAAIISACAAAHARGGAPVWLSMGIYMVGDGLSLNGYKCTLLGPGGRLVELVANTQTGYVLDLTGWPGNQAYTKTPMGGFRLQGDGTADATKAKGGLKIVGNHLIRYFDIGVWNTGGPCLRMESAWGCELDGLNLGRPVSAGTNDVPYVHTRGWCNLNRWDHLTLHSGTADADGTAIVLIEDDGSFATHDSVFRDTACEFLHVPTNGAIFSVQAYALTIDGIQLADCSGVTGATNNCVVRFRNDFARNALGGNEVRGVIPGKGTEASAWAAGVILEQSRCRVTGVRGYRDNNVLLQPNVEYSYIELGGTVSGTGGADSVIDNSGKTTNVIMDHTRRYYRGGPGSNNPARLTKSGIAPAGTAVLTLPAPATYHTGTLTGWCQLRIAVRYSISANLQSHYVYQDLTVTSTTTGGGTISAVREGSSGNFQTATGNFVVTRPSNGTIVVTYTSTNVAGNNDIVFEVLDAHNFGTPTIA